MTPFQQALEQLRNGQLTAPKVANGGNAVDYMAFQLAGHRFALRVLSSGMKMRNTKLADIKKYYGLKGRSAADCLVEFEQIRTESLAQLHAAQTDAQ